MAKPRINPKITDLIPKEKLDTLSDAEKLVEYMKLAIPEYNIKGYSVIHIEFNDGSKISYQCLMNEVLGWGITKFDNIL